MIVGLFGMSLIQASLSSMTLIMVMAFFKVAVGDGISDDGSISILGFHINLPFAELLSNSNNAIIALFVCISLLVVMVSIVRLIQKHLALKVQNKFTRNVRQSSFDKLLSLEIGYFTSTRMGDIAYLQNTIVGRFSQLIPFTFELLNSVVNSCLVGAILFKMSVSLASILAVAAVTLFIATGFMRRKSSTFSFIAAEKSKAAGSIFLELVHGIRLIRQAGQEDRARKDYLGAAIEREDAILHLTDYQNIVRAIVEISGSLGVVFLVLGVSVIADLTLLDDIGFTLGFFVVAWGALSNVQRASDLSLRVAQMTPYLSMVAEFLNDDSHDRSERDASMPDAPPIRSAIELKNVSFGYEDTAVLFEDISLNFPIGSSTALVGLSGSGKSTLLEILGGFQHPSGGGILADGCDRACYSMRSNRSRIGYVTQDMILFNSSIRENLLFFKPNATEREIQSAIELSMTDEFISTIPDGLDTVVGERGMKISGGQRQRLALARVLRQDPDVLLLDEATSALDLYTESKIYENLSKRKADKIIVVAAHRLSAITNFDNIVVFNNGKIAEQGHHRDLMAADGIYHGLFRIQQLSSNAD